VGIGGRAKSDEGADISDTDAHPDGVVRQAFSDFNLIQIARLTIVDRRPQLGSHVAHILWQGVVRRIVEGADFVQHRARELGLEAVFTHRRRRRDAKALRR
jgi:hypothetical protein